MSSALSGIADLVGSIINSIIAVITSIFDAIQSVLGVGFGAVKDVGGLARGLIDFVLRESLTLTLQSLLERTAVSAAVNHVERKNTDAYVQRISS